VLVDRAAWTSETTLDFFREGADAGRLQQPLADGTRCTVLTVRLRDYITQRVDLLKLDVEGAETDVVLDIADRLVDVRRVFVEYHSFAGQPQRLHELVGVLHASGFRQPLNLGMDLQLNIFAYRDG
jgi:hypothetical protein